MKSTLVETDLPFQIKQSMNAFHFEEDIILLVFVDDNERGFRINEGSSISSFDDDDEEEGNVER